MQGVQNEIWKGSNLIDPAKCLRNKSQAVIITAI